MKTKTNTIENIERLLLNVPEFDDEDTVNGQARSDAQQTQDETVLQKYISGYLEKPRSYAVKTITSVITSTRSRLQDKSIKDTTVDTLSDSEKLIISIYRNLSKPMKKKAELILLALKD